MKILVIEDDPKIAELLVGGLGESGFETELISDGRKADEALRQPERYDLAVLDWMLPGLDGLTLLQRARQAKKHLPVVMLSARHTSEDRIAGLSQGADDYVVKPFSFAELLIRIQNLLRRHSAGADSNVLQFEDLTVDLVKREVHRAGKRIELHVKEFSLLVCLLRNRGRVLSKTLLLKEVWGYEFDPQTNVVDVLVCRLRNKIDRDFDSRLIHTIRGLGYVCRKEQE